jgi:hypothetical protein
MLWQWEQPFCWKSAAPEAFADCADALDTRIAALRQPKAGRRNRFDTRATSALPGANSVECGYFIETTFNCP